MNRFSVSEHVRAVLQIVALSLPAIALYMSVLTELYEVVDQAKALYPDPDSPAYQEGRMGEGQIENEVLRGFVTYSVAETGWDFRLATVSLLCLVLSAPFLMLALGLGNQWVSLAGIGLAALGFLVLSVALGYTVFASLKLLYPRS